jgi:hypothetical protein
MYMEVFQMNLVSKLRKFRQQCERETGVSANDLELPLAHVLDDLGRALAVPSKSRRKVVGRKSWVRLENVKSSRVVLKDRSDQ